MVRRAWIHPAYGTHSAPHEGDADLNGPKNLRAVQLLLVIQARLSPVPDYVPKHMQTPLAGQAHALRGT